LGRREGKIMNNCSLCSEDSSLTNVWKSCIEIHQEPADRIWEDEMIRILTKAGCTVRKG